MTPIGSNELIILALLAFWFSFAVWLGWFRPRKALPPMEVFPVGNSTGDQPPPEDLEITWLGHSSYRLDWGGAVLLLDPVVSGHVSVAPRRVSKPDPECFKGVQAVLLSHGHMDHFNNETLARVNPCQLFLPLKSERFLRRTNRERYQVNSFRMGDTFRVGGVDITVVPARHGGWRYPWQRGFFACGFILRHGGYTLYCAGDSAWGPHFREIGLAFQPDLALLPIGGYSPRWFLRSRHLNPPEAVEASRQLGVSRVIPCHYGTYRVSMEGMAAPIRWFRREILTLRTGPARISDPRS